MKIQLTALLVGGMMVADAAGATNLVSNGSFETPISSGIATFGTGSTSITGWTVIGASDISVLLNGIGGIVPDDGQQFLDLTGTRDNQGVYSGVSQTLSTLDGVAYTLQFALGNYSQNPGITGIAVTAGSAAQTFTLARPASGFVWETFSLNFLGGVGGSTLISFTGTNGGFYTGLDDVYVESVSAPVTPAVPEPGTWAMLVAGFGLVGMVSRRQRRTRTA
jgi:hypothetical protein